MRGLLLILAALFLAACAAPSGSYGDGSSEIRADSGFKLKRHRGPGR